MEGNSGAGAVQKRTFAEATARQKREKTTTGGGKRQVVDAEEVKEKKKQAWECPPAEKKENTDRTTKKIDFLSRMGRGLPLCHLERRSA